MNINIFDSTYSLYSNPYAASTSVSTDSTTNVTNDDKIYKIVEDTSNPVAYLSQFIDPVFIVENSFYAHYFDSGYTSANDSKDFAPRYAVAKTTNPFQPGTTDVISHFVMNLIISIG